MFDLNFRPVYKLPTAVRIYQVLIYFNKYMLGITGGDIMLRNYRENFTDLDDNGTIFLDELLPFAPVVDSKGKELVLRKSTITWYFDNDKTKLSSDRLVRVKEKEYSRNILGKIKVV